jgi:hypothetical protein
MGKREEGSPLCRDGGATTAKLDGTVAGGEEVVRRVNWELMEVEFSLILCVCVCVLLCFRVLVFFLCCLERE